MHVLATSAASLNEVKLTFIYLYWQYNNPDYSVQNNPCNITVIVLCKRSKYKDQEANIKNVEFLPRAPAGRLVGE
jgi:hypothetical protein